MQWVTKLNKPWLHFIVLGAVFYQLQGAIFPEPKTMIGPLSDARINALQQQWRTNTGQQPSPRQSAQLIETELNKDVLLQRALELNIHRYDNIVYQRLIRNMNFLQLADGKTDNELFEQALDMRLHLDDNVIKRRLIQMMEQRLLANNPPLPPSDEAIKAEFDQRFSELRKPPLYSIEHIFFNQDRESEAPLIIATITEQKLDFQAAKHFSSPYLQGYKFDRQSPRQLAQNFGNSFVLSLKQAVPTLQSVSQPVAQPLAQWLGPMRSAFGLHYVWLNALEPARDAQLKEVEPQLRRDLDYAAQAQALQNAITHLRENYDVSRPSTEDLEGKTIEARQ